MDNSRPIIIKRVKRYVVGHRGGSQRIAFAGSATVIMAFFPMLWLLSSATPEQKKMISGYFQDSIGFSENASPHVIDLGGTPMPTPDKAPNPRVQAQPDSNESQVSLEQDYQANVNRAENLVEQVERERLTLLLQGLQNKVDESPMLKDLEDQIRSEITRDDLRIQIVDAANRPMFDLDNARLQPYFEDIPLVMAETIHQVPNKISISGHTDAKPYAGNDDFGNWELSANRANATRRALVAGGHPERQIAQVVGHASVRLFDDKDPLNPVNRWIDIVVLTRKVQKATEGETGAPEASAPAAASGEQSKPAAEAPAVGTQSSLPADEVQKKLNLFDDGGSPKLEQIKGD